MKNWKDYVGFQQTTDWFWHKPTKFNSFYLTIKRESIVSITIERKDITPSDFIHSEDNIGDAVESLLVSFPTWEIEDKKEWNDPDSLYKKCTIARINNKIAQNSRRGVGNSEFEFDKGTVYFYKGYNNQLDSPIIVSQYLSNEGDKGYFVMKHPDFDRYGFVVEK